MLKKLSTMLASLRGTPAAGSGCNQRRPHRFLPQLEALEDRRVMSVTYDYTQIAQMFPRHAGPTNLYLNFDGWQAQRVSPYHASFEDADPATDDRARDIQEILFRTSEIFSPFDVQVKRIFGNGQHATSGGHSTIFIGDDADNGGGTNNQMRSYVTAGHGDYPGAKHGAFHRPNSNPFDVGFVDPYSWAFALGNQDIARSIAHEAGHTFGLAHVLSPSLPDIMNYDVTVPSHRFVDRTLNLTALNGTPPKEGYGLVPLWHFDLPGTAGHDYHSYKLKTQNSFRTLEATLGARPADDYISFQNGDSVERDAPLLPTPIAGPTGSGQFTTELRGTIGRYGDYDVFTYTAGRRESLTIRVQSLTLRPVILGYEGYNITPVKAFNYDTIAAGSGFTQINLGLGTGESLTFVVGGVDGASFGVYHVTVQSMRVLPVVDTRPPRGGGVFTPVFGPATPAPVLTGVFAVSTRAAATPAAGAAPAGLALQPVGASAPTAGQSSAGRSAALDAVFADVTGRPMNRTTSLDEPLAVLTLSSPKAHDGLTDPFASTGLPRSRK